MCTGGIEDVIPDAGTFEDSKRPLPSMHGAYSLKQPCTRSLPLNVIGHLLPYQPQNTGVNPASDFAAAKICTPVVEIGPIEVR